MKTTFLVALLAAQTAVADSTILPVADGSVYSSGNVVTSAYITISSPSIEGDLQFASFSTASYGAIELELNPYGLPLFGNPISVYGYDNAPGALTASDYNAGTFLGSWTLPANLTYGQPAYFDVTTFVDSTKGAYFGFELQGGSDVFSSTGINYGTPPALVAKTIPEPSTLILLGFPAVVAIARYRQTRNGHARR